MQCSDPPATLLRRLTAGVIDFVVLVTAIQAIGWFCSQSKSVATLLVTPLAAIAFLYPFVTHARFGMTLGKFFLKIRVIRLDGTAIGWNESLRRSAVDGVFALLWAVGLLVAVSNLTAEVFAGQGWPQLYKLIQPQLPSYHEWMMTAAGVWTWSEYLTMFFNRQRRAVHDFIASTKVVNGRA